MRVVAFDGRTGAAGDMILGALVAAGADPAVLQPVTDTLPVSYEFSDVTEQGIAATRARVLHDEAEATDDAGETDEAAADAHDHDHTHAAVDDSHAHDDDSHAHDETHEHGGAHQDDAHDDSHAHDETHAHDAEGAGPARSYAAVVSLVESMDVPEAVAANALAAFRLLGEAEAAVHDTELQRTTFHEVGTDDAIADVVGAAALLADLDPDRVVVTPLAAGGGETTFSHGTYPVPTPAVTEIAARSGLSIATGPVDRELLTPTGAAILGAVAEPVERLPATTTDAAGYGAGGFDLGDRPNVLRATVGTTTDGPAHTTDAGHESNANADDPEPTAGAVADDRLTRDEIAVLETNLDDATPEILGSLQETLLAAGAKDVSVLPVTMKKARPGHLVKVICDPADARRLARRLAEETGTLGVRQTAAGHRWIADRRFETVELSVGETAATVEVKVASDGTAAYDVSCEYDDALQVAREHDLPVRTVCRRAEQRVWDRLE